MIQKKANLYCIPLKHALGVGRGSRIGDKGTLLILNEMLAKEDTIEDDERAILWHKAKDVH